VQQYVLRLEVFVNDVFEMYTANDIGQLCSNVEECSLLSIRFDVETVCARRHLAIKSSERERRSPAAQTTQTCVDTACRARANEVPHVSRKTNTPPSYVEESWELTQTKKKNPRRRRSRANKAQQPTTVEASTNRVCATIDGAHHTIDVDQTLEEVVFACTQLDRTPTLLVSLGRHQFHLLSVE
jgi:hypothetical protein